MVKNLNRYKLHVSTELKPNGIKLFKNASNLYTVIIKQLRKETFNLLGQQPF